MASRIKSSDISLFPHCDEPLGHRFKEDPQTGIRTSRDMEEKIKLLYSQGRSIRKIVETTGVARNTVRSILRAEEPAPPSECTDWTAALDWARVCEELGRGATIKVLHQEFAPDGISYKMFWHQLRKRKPTSPVVSMRLRHEPGERTYFDFCDGATLESNPEAEL